MLAVGGGAIVVFGGLGLYFGKIRPEAEAREAQTRAALEKLIEIRSRMTANEARLQAINNEANEIAQDQARLRENIKALSATPEAKQLITRYVAKADTQESRLEQLEKDRRAAFEEQGRLQLELATAIRGFSLDRQLK